MRAHEFIGVVVLVRDKVYVCAFIGVGVEICMNYCVVQ